MRRYIGIILFFIGIGNYAYTQNEFDALRYSMHDFYGGARFNAMGGAFGALGANLSGLSVNPGGIGVYKSSDFSLTPAFHYNHSNSKAGEFNSEAGNLNFHLGNLGFVGNIQGKGKWKSSSFALGYNRTTNFNNSTLIKAATDNSALTIYTDALNSDGGTSSEDIEIFFPFSANLAYQTYLVNPLSSDSSLYSHVLSGSENIGQKVSYETRGGMGEYFITYGSNYMDKLYIGGSFGLSAVRYRHEREYQEVANAGDTLTDLESFTIQDQVKTTGTGVVLKLGGIYKVKDWFRLGLAFHTPTFYSLQDEYQTNLNSSFKEDTLYSQSEYSFSSPTGSFNYYVTTPYRVITSAAFIVGSRGAINVDYEVIDYSMARLKSNRSLGGDYDFFVENENTKNNFRTTQNIRVGTEWRLDPFRLRAGYRIYGNPIADAFTLDKSSQVYSFGVGVKQEGYYFDMAYSLKTYKDQSAIIQGYDDFAAVDLKDHYFMFTLGFRF